MQFRNNIIIKASADRIFKALTDLPAYPDWHPGMAKITGNLALDKSLTLYMKLGKRVIKVPVIVTRLENNLLLEWQGSLFQKGKLRQTFLVRHAFIIEVVNDKECIFTNEEEFSPLLSLFVNRMQKAFIAGYQNVNEALKAYCEAPANC